MKLIYKTCFTLFSMIVLYVVMAWLTTRSFNKAIISFSVFAFFLGILMRILGNKKREDDDIQTVFVLLKMRYLGAYLNYAACLGVLMLFMVNFGHASFLRHPILVILPIAILNPIIWVVVSYKLSMGLLAANKYMEDVRK